MKRLLSVCLALMMLAAMLPASLAIAEEPTVLTIGSTFADYHIEDMEIFKELEKKLNIKIEFTFYSMDNFSVMLADGSLPDIMLARWQYMPNLLESGLALNLAPYIDEYMPNLKNPLYANTVEIQKALFTGPEEDGVYFICPYAGLNDAEGGTDQYRGYILRWDYYKELGCPEIKNDEDFLNVLLQMQKNHPTTEDGKPTFAYGVHNSLKNMGGYRGSWLTSTAVNLWCSYQYKGSLYDNTLVNCYTDTERSAYWADMRFYNKLFRAGQFDLDIFTMSMDEYDAKVSEGRYMGIYYGDNSFYKSNLANDPNSLAGYVAIPSEGTIVYADGVWPLGNGVAYPTIINAKSPNKELAMTFYNELYDPDFSREWYSGKQGVHWDYDENGVPRLFPETLEMYRTNDPAFFDAGWGNYDSIMIPYSSNTIHPDGYYMNLFEADRETKIAGQNPLQLDYAEHYGVEYWVDAMYNTMMNMSHDFNETIQGGVMDLPTETERTLAMCDDVLYNAMPSLIMAGSDEEFLEIQQDVLQQLEELGEGEIWAWYSAEWEKAREAAMPYFEAAREQLLPKQ